MSYATVVPKINAAMRDNPDTFARGLMFAILSARQPFDRVREMMVQVDAVGAKAKSLFGWKRGAYIYIQEHKETLWREVCAATDTHEALLILSRVPGLGIVKSAFVLQFLGHDIACLDTRNIQREKLNRIEYKVNKSQPKHYAAKAGQYIQETQGRACELWDAWCADVAKIYHMTPQECSERHLDIVPARLWDLPTQACPIYTKQEVPF